MEKRLNKRGQGLSTNAIILIVLGVVVLVILIAGFTIGWANIAPWLSSENVGTVVSSCETACSTNNVYAFCSKERELVDAEKNKIKTTCNVFAELSEYDEYGVASCSSIECKTSVNCEDVVISEKNKDERTAVLRDGAACEAGETLLTGLVKPVDGKVCCIAQ